jgi:hypothetical protein
MTAPATVSEAELMQRTGLTQRAALKRELTRLRIRYFSSRGGVWTTAAALDAALGLRGEDPPERRIRITGHAPPPQQT